MPTPFDLSTKEFILEKSFDLFSKNDFGSISISKIAKEANTSKSNVLHHFQNKKNLALKSIEAGLLK